MKAVSKAGTVFVVLVHLEFACPVLSTQVWIPDLTSDSDPARESRTALPRNTYIALRYTLKEAQPTTDSLWLSVALICSPALAVRSRAPAQKGEVRSDRQVPFRPFLGQPESRICPVTG